MPTLVAFPVLWATLRLHLDKGKRWNALEHLLLHAVCDGPQSAPELAAQSNLPRRLVIEVMIRLMRVGWVELVSSKEKSGFQGTAAGRRVVRYEFLPAVTRPLSRRGSFVIDQVSGTLFRGRELTLYAQARLEKVKQSADVVVLPREVENARPQIDEVISTLLDEDEHCRDVDPSGAKPVERYAIVRVDGEVVEGLPARAPAVLKQRIKDAVRSVKDAEPSQRQTVRSEPADTANQLEPLEIVFNQQDLVIGGTAHRVVVETALRKTKFRFVAHSTFVNAEKFASLLPLIKDAARRGVQVDILWGKSAEREGGNTTAIEVERCRALLQEDYLRERVRLHNFTTNSHAKMLLADNGRGQMFAVIGSCNWFSSGFESFDVSAYFSDPIIVSAVAGSLATMTVGASGHWTQLTRDLGALSATLRRAPRPSGPKAKARIVLGDEHSFYVRMARDEAKRRILITSHRFSDNAETTVLLPAKAAMEAHGIDVTLLYGRTSGAAEGKLARSLTSQAIEHGIQLRQIHRPRLHAKVLAWDDDSIVVTSQNWLSADPPDSHPYSEVGIYLSSTGIAQEFIQLTESALRQH